MEAKEVTTPFLVCDTERLANDFIAFINTPVYRTIHIPELGRTWRLRPLAHPSNSITAGATNFSLRFSIDVPNCPQIQVTPDGGGVTLPEEGYELDAIPFSRYGIVVKTGIENLLISPSIKQDLTHNFTTSDGQLYEATAVRFHSKDLTLN
ncbi:MAG: hypothetical protein LIO97_02385 [Tannerellaceae bacterium]|nr:hypothetical protein [Tannerellaceae bacterium]